MSLSIRSLALAGLFTATGAIAAGFYFTQQINSPDTNKPAEPLGDWILPPAQALTPTDNNGLPTLAPMLSRVTPAVVNIYTKQTVRSNRLTVEEYYRGIREPAKHISQSLGAA